jgi:hypothetical protein
MRIARTRILAAALATAAFAAPALADQPHMEKALNHLRQAKSELEAARSNKGGHRDHALDSVNKAISQVEQGIEYAKTHRD